MTTNFSIIPNKVMVPLFYAEMDNSQANTTTATQPSVILGHALEDSSIPVNELVLVSSVSELKEISGAGSQLSRMVAAYRNIDAGGQLWVIAIPEPEGTAAASDITVGGQVIAGGVISLYVGKTRVQITVALGDTPTKIATAMSVAINAISDLPVTAASDGETPGLVTLTAKHVGLCGNEIPITVNYYGSAGGERLPNGVTVTITAMTGGAGAPDLTDALTSLGDESADFIAFPFNDSASLDAIGLAMNDSTGRWSPGRLTYGHVYSAKIDTLTNLQSFGTTRNDQHVTISGIEPAVQTCADELASMTTARNAVFIRADPARPTQTGQMNGALPAPTGKRFNKTQQNTLLSSGIATCYAEAGNMFIQRAITTYQKNAFGDPDNSYLDSETLHTSVYVLRDLQSTITSKYARCKLADDGTRYGSGQSIVTPSVIRGEICARYQALEVDGVVENFDLFKQYLIVERDANDSSRVNVLYPPDYVNQLRVFAVLNQFRLQYQEEAV